MTETSEEGNHIHTDLSQVFGWIKHKTLLQKFVDIGIQGKLFMGLESYLTVTSQESHLDPLLFSIYVIDIALFSIDTFTPFADENIFGKYVKLTNV